MLDAQLLIVLVLLGALVAAAWLAGGSALAGRGLVNGIGLLQRYGVLLVASFLAAGLAEALLPQDWIHATLGRSSGLRGVVIAAAAGAIVPAGPFVSLPAAALLLRAGAGVGPVVAFVTGWALLALHRLVAWELPILGWRFALLRYAVCLVLPVAAGLAAAAVARVLAR